MVPLLDDIADAKQQAQIYVMSDDRGSGIVSFLKTKIGDKNYAEILGNMLAINVPEGSDSRLIQTLEIMLDPKAELDILQGDKVIKSYGKLSGFVVKTDIALPGLKKGEVRVS